MVNPRTASFGQLTDWEGMPLSRGADRRKPRQAEPAAGAIWQRPGAASMAVELNHVDAAELGISRCATRCTASGRTGSILMLGRDLRPMAEVQQQLVQAQLALERDYEAQRELDTRYRVLMEVTRDPVMLVVHVTRAGSPT